MKRKLFLLLCALLTMIGVQKTQAYTVSDLTSAGWTQVTTSSITGVGDNYYMLVDANSSAYVMSNDAAHFRPCYKTIADPVANPSFVWILEGSNNEFAIKSNSTGAYFKQASGWNTSMGYPRDSRTKVTGVFELSGGKYTLKCKETGNYVGHWNDDGAAVASDGENIAANKAASNAPGFYLYSISKSVYNAALVAARATGVASATKASPVDVTSYIQNADFSNDWGGWECTIDASGNMQWTGSHALESWNATNVVVKQELAGVPNGLYKFTGDVISGPGATKAAYLYATGDATVNSATVSAEASANNYTTMSNEVAGNTLTADNVYVTGNAITVGMNQSTGWVVADNFKLYYYGPTIKGNAVEFTTGDAVTAGQWYYFDVAAAGDYQITTTDALSNIVYTTDGTILIEDEATVTTNPTAVTALTAGRLYFKSSTAATITIAPDTYTYEVNAPTVSIADASYIQSLTTISFDFTSAATTNDPDATFALLNGSATASLKLAGSEVATGTLSLSGKVLTATFSEVSLAQGSTYTVEIAANVVGYEDQAANTAISTSFKTPAIFDGVYYMYNTYTQTYLSRGGNYGTQAILDNYGMAVVIATDANNATTVQYFDITRYLGDDGFCYADCSGTRIRTYNVTSVDGGYKFLNTNNSKYLAVYNGQAVGDAVEGDNLQGTSNIWALESTTSHVANYTTNADAQVAAATANITALSSITTKTALEEELANNYGKTSIDITGSKAEKYQVYATNANPSVEATYYSETVSGLTPGLYKLSVDAFQRAGSYANVAAADGARGLIYLYAGTAKTQVKSVMDASSASAYSSDYAVDDKHYPNNEASAYTALENCDYSNDVYVYVAADDDSETGSLEIGIKNPNYPGANNGCWAVYNNFTLTYYEAKATDEEKAALAAAIEAAEAKTLGFDEGEYAPYNNVDAITALAAANAIDPETASGEAVVNATTALTGATWTDNTEEVNAVYNGDFALSENDGAQVGWQTDHNAGLGGAYHARAFVLNPGDGNYDNLAAFGQGDATRSCSYFRFDGTNSAKTTKYTYGATEGYTMPLKTGTIYKLTAQAGGWGQVDKNFRVAIVSSTDENVVAQNLKTPATGVNDGGSVIDYEMYFVVPAAGDYKMVLTNPDNVDNAIVISNIVLKSTEALVFADDAAVPTYAPGTYPSVKITRTLAANRWATAVYPFAVSGVDEIAVLDSYNNETGVVGFTSAAASTANEPFLMRSTAGTAEISLSNVAVAATAAEPVATKNEASLKGVYANGTVSEEADVVRYVVSNNLLYKVNSDVNIKPFRAYFELADGNSSARLAFNFDDATGINAIEAAEAEAGALKDGKYLENGKIVIVKNGIKYSANGQKLN